MDEQPKFDHDLYGNRVVAAGYCPPDNAVQEAQAAGRFVLDAAKLVYDKAHRTIVEKRQDAYPASKALQTREAELIQERDAALAYVRISREAMQDWRAAAETLAADLADAGARTITLRDAYDRAEAEIERLRAQLWLPTEQGDHNYHGPVDKDRQPIPDPAHERFHGAVGDVLAGRIIPEARRQMQEALKSAPKEKAPFPTTPSGDDPKRMALNGWQGSDWHKLFLGLRRQAGVSLSGPGDADDPETCRGRSHETRGVSLPMPALWIVAYDEQTLKWQMS